MRYFTSDIHFADDDTFLHDDRPFKDIDDYDKKTIKIWNKIMTKNDTLYVVGDLFDCLNADSKCYLKAATYFKKIKVKIVLILGNNEERIIKFFFNNNFQKFKDFCLQHGIADVKRNEKLNFGGRKFYLTHKPINYKKGFVNLVGHLHRSRGQWYSFGLNVSCDLNHFRPYSEEQILWQLQEKENNFKDENFTLI